LLVLSVGCAEYELYNTDEVKDGPLPHILVEPAAIDFGTWSSQDTTSRTVRITNIGEADLRVDDVLVFDQPEFDMNYGGVWNLTIEPDDFIEFEATFNPRSGGERSGWITVYSDGANEQESVVDLVGFGAVPQLQIDPNPVNFGAQFIGCDDEATVTFTNIGAEELVISATDFSSDGQIELYAIDPLPMPLTIAPAEQVEVGLRYAPTVEADAQAVLTVTSNDPAGEHVHLSDGSGVYAATFDDQFTVPENPPVDILFAVDQSCSMDDQTSDLAQAFGEFINEINNVTTGWHLGVVTNDNGCFNQGVLTSSTNNYQSKFTSAVSTGGCTAGSPSCLTEALLRLTSVSLSKTGGGCNANFLRSGAMLHVIVVSDEEEQSNTNWLTWVNEFGTYVASPNHLKISAVVDVNTSCGDGTGADGYDDAANYTGGELLNICNANWASQIATLSAASLTNIFRYELTETGADEASISVYVDGALNSDWHYDSGSNEVVFDVELDANQTIDVSYGIVTACD